MSREDLTTWSVFERSRPAFTRSRHLFRQKVIDSTLGLITLFVVLLLLFPILWMFSTALRPPSQVFTIPTPLLPSELSFQAFVNVWTTTELPLWYMNSIIVALGVIVLTTTTATLGGYGLTRVDIPYKRTFARGILFGYMFPAMLLAIPMFIMWRQMGWINSYIGLILAETAPALPFSLWLMWKYFQTVPVSVEESARMAGATRFRAFYEIALPMAKPGIVAIAVFAWAGSWNAFTMPTILMVNSQKWVLTIGIFSFTNQQQIQWAQLMAASSLTILPSFLLVYFMQKYLLRGFRAGGIG